MTRLQSIEHFVVLMLENRSFDNLLGGLYPKSKDFEGVDGSESNTDRSGKVWPLTETPGGDVAGLSVPNPDPGELWQDINVQIFGSGQLHEDEPYQPRDGAVADMSGFVESYTDPRRPSRAGNDARRIMSRYKPDRDVPALATLARQFAVCDSWFASAPCQTWPNRFFVHTGTADGYENNNPKALFFKMPTVFNSFDRAPSKPSWALYHHDLPQTLTLSELIRKAQNFHMFDTFLRHAREGVFAELFLHRAALLYGHTLVSAAVQFAQRHASAACRLLWRPACRHRVQCFARQCGSVEEDDARHHFRRTWRLLRSCAAAKGDSAGFGCRRQSPSVSPLIVTAFAFPP